MDSSMIMGYGQDDRVCAYTSLVAMLEVDKPEKTTCCLLVDKEEIGSVGATGMQSKFFENTVAEIIDRIDKYKSLHLEDV
jgi:aspartyl aminopeptidase